MSIALLLSIRNPPPQVGINKGVAVTQSGTTRMRRCNTGPPLTASGDGELSAGARVFGNRPLLITPFVGEMTHKGTLGSTAREIPLPHPTLIGNGRRGLTRLRLPARSRGPRARLPHSNRGAGHWGWRTPPPPRVTLRRVVVSLRGPGQSPALPFACCVGSLRSVGRCGRCSCRCRFRVRGAQSLVCWGCAECGGMCRLRVSGAQ